MARVSGTFNSPLLFGFDHFDRMLDRISKTSAVGGYPPDNIEQVAEDGLRLTLAWWGSRKATCQ